MLLIVINECPFPHSFPVIQPTLFIICRLPGTLSVLLLVDALISDTSTSFRPHIKSTKICNYFRKQKEVLQHQSRQAVGFPNLISRRKSCIAVKTAGSIMSTEKTGCLICKVLCCFSFNQGMTLIYSLLSKSVVSYHCLLKPYW